MSIKAVDWALREAPVTDTSAVLVLVGLANHASDEGKDAYPSRATLARYARCSVRTVTTKLKALEGAGIIERGDQQKVAHLRPDRRPVVYDLNYDAQPLPPVEQDDDVQNLPPENDVQNLHPAADGVKSTTPRGEIHDTTGGNGLHTNRPITVNEPSVVVEDVKSPEQPEMRSLRNGWQPGSRAMATAKQTAKLLDIQLHIVRYEVWCTRNKRQPNDGEWLTWLTRDEQEARDKERKEQQDKRNGDSWYAVAD